ncbi:MAG TPA: hypothetical protein PKM73_08425 [Verrucomicrobiota bacterium]|nr:hypothetical protein [Verrucomicrobiota bacterium]HNU49573.1 hypothetical protein [Verrucomicrobiota bacterium]
MSLFRIGPPLFERGDNGRPRTNIATLFLDPAVLVTTPGFHGSQRLRFLEWMNGERVRQGLPVLDAAAEARLCEQSVDLIVAGDVLQIRPDPSLLDAAFAADELLQEEYLKPQIRFLNVDLSRVQQAIKERGELWRISALPTSRAETIQLIQGSRVAIREQPVYYYNAYSGTRHLTYAGFASLARCQPGALARQLQEIADHCRALNRLGEPEVAFFATDASFGPGDFAGVRFVDLSAEALQAAYAQLVARFEAAVPADLRQDDPQEELWRTRMFSALIGHRDESATEVALAGLNPDFNQRIRWLPGGRFEQGELMVDTVFEQAKEHPELSWFQGLCDDKVRDFIFNFMREYGRIEYVNVGRILTSSGGGSNEGGRREVYVAELKQMGQPGPITRFMRLQKYGVRERLDEGKDLARALLETEYYTEYILDRRLGCWYLGMAVRLEVNMRRFQEAYQGTQTDMVGLLVPVTYFERAYVPGFPARSLPRSRYARPEYALRLARLLGAAAVPNLIVGRARESTGEVVFDQGDEVVVEDAHGLPERIVVTDNAGSFVAWRQESLLEFARAYARPVNERTAFVGHPREFAGAYLEAFEARFREVQSHYRQHRRAFDTLFKHLPFDEKGSYACRWAHVLRRLDQADPQALTRAIGTHIAALPFSELPQSAPPPPI